MLLEFLVVSLLVNGVFFIFAAALKTDKVTDLSYSLTFITLAIFGLIRLPRIGNTWQIVLALLIVVWAIRLGGFLLMRIMRTGKDLRFDGMREKPLRFARFWVLQAVTVWIVLFPYCLALPTAKAASPWYAIGALVWLCGLYLEARSDMEKYRFRNDPANAGRPVDCGLWRYSRHPNYFGEMLIWWGFWLAAIPAWSEEPGLVLLAALGPASLSMLLLFVSGVPLLEKQAARRYGPAWEEYAGRTSLLVPWKPKRPAKNR